MIKETLVNRLYIWIWSFSLTFTALMWMKTNCRFLLRSGYESLVKIWRWLKVLNSVPFIKKTLVNHVYIRIWYSWRTVTVLQWMKTNFKISQFSRFLLRSVGVIQVKIWQWQKLLNSFAFIKKTLVNRLYIWIWWFWLTFTALMWMKTNLKKLVNLKISAKVQVCDFLQNLKMTKTS